MAKFIWQNGTLVSKAKVEIDGTIYEVDPEEYSGTTPLSASNLNAMQDGIYEDIGDLSNLNTTDKSSLVGAINEINEKTVYSTSEQVVGKWINNKPIYRKVVTFDTSTFRNNIDLETGITNIDEVIKLDCEIKSSQDNGWRNIPWLYGSGTSSVSGGWTGGFFLRENGKVFFQFGNNLLELSKVILIVEYTKTTD